jgi:hypothetical protein
MGEPPTPPIRRPQPPPTDFPRPEPLTQTEQALRRELELRFHLIRDLEAMAPSSVPGLPTGPHRPMARARELQGAWKRELGDAYHDLLATTIELGELLRRLRGGRQPPP